MSEETGQDTAAASETPAPATPTRRVIPPYDPPDGRTPEQLAEDARLRKLVQERVARGVRPDGTSKAKPATAAQTPELPRRTELEALRGTRGVDYFPNDVCARCGAMVWFDGVRYQQSHDPDKHGAEPEAGEGVDARRVAQSKESTGNIAERITKAATGTRYPKPRKDWDDED